VAPEDSDDDGDGYTDNVFFQEAEDGDLYGAFEIGSDTAASGGRYVHVPNGRLTKYEKV